MERIKINSGFGSRLIYLFIFLFSIFFILDAIPVQAVSLLNNPGPTRRCWEHGECDSSGCDTPAYADNCEECDVDGNANSGCTDWCGTEDSCPTTYLITYNWYENDYQEYPGWDFWATGGYGSYMTLAALNNAKNASSPCNLREVTAVHFHNYNGDQSFTGTYDLDDYNEFHFKFKAKLRDYNGPPACTTVGQRTAYITADVGVELNNDEYLIGVLIYNAGTDQDLYPYPAYDDPNNEIFWVDNVNDPHHILLNGPNLGIGVTTLNDSTFTTYNIDYKYLFEEYFETDLDDAEIYFAEVYASVRGADLSFWLTEADFTGEN